MEVNPVELSNSPSCSANKSNIYRLFATGFALFSMFFGAGNLIFPLLIGKAVGPDWWVATLGLAITAVFVPFLGLAAMIFYNGDSKYFFGRLGSVPGFVLLLLLQLILGPFGVIPRLITLMNAILKHYFIVSLPVFSCISAIIIFICCYQRQNLIRNLGVILTPILLVSLAFLFFFGFLHATPIIEPPSLGEASSSFLHGLLVGYNTMDLIAAFLFATVVLPHFQKEITEESPIDEKKALSQKVLVTSLIAATLLLFTYIGLSYIAAHHGPSVEYASSEEFLGAIAFKLLGKTGGFFAALAILTACLTTAITLSIIFADYLRNDLCNQKISSQTALVITLLCAAGFANLGFGNIAAFLGPVLEICYPGLIVLTIFNILHYTRGIKTVKTPVFLTFLISGLYYFYNMVY